MSPRFLTSGSWSTCTRPLTSCSHAPALKCLLSARKSGPCLSLELLALNVSATYLATSVPCHISVWASLVVQLVKSLPAMQETLVQFLGQEDPLKKGWATHSSILVLPWWFSWEIICLQCRRPGLDPWVGNIPWRRAWRCSPVFLPGESQWTEEPGGLGHDWVTTHKLLIQIVSFHTSSFESGH